MHRETTPHHQQQSGEFIRQLGRLPQTKILLILLGILCALFFLEQDQQWAEWYATTVYPWLSSVIAYIPSFLPFSLGEALVIAAFLALIVYIGRGGHLLITSKNNRCFLTAKLLINLLCTVTVALLCFMLLAGINYHRKEFSDLCGLTIKESTSTYNSQELLDLGVYLVNEMEEAREAIGKDTDIYKSNPEAFFHYARQSVSLLQKLNETYPVFERPLFSPPKPVVLSEALCYANIAGMFFPFTAESNINTKDPLFTQPFTMAHELAHQSGFMREDEANFIAFLACMESSDPLIRYSGSYQAFVHVLPLLRRVDPLAATNLWEEVPESIKEDNRYYSEFLKQYEGPVKEASTQINDAYLRANSQHDGVAAYDRMVNLLLAWYDEKAD